MIRALVDAFRVRRSGLLQPAYYRSQFYQELGPDRVVLRLAPCLHYVLFGARANKNPNPFFDTQFYRETNPDAASGMNPLAHFVREGVRQRRDPSPYFNTGYYLDTDPALARAGVNPLRHFLRHGQVGGRLPNPLLTTVRRLERPAARPADEGRGWLLQALGPSATGDSQGPPTPSRAIRFEWDRGGWNNIRMQVEVMIGLASLFDRALVLPDAGRWYLVPGEATHLFDFFDEASFRAAVPVLSSPPAATDEWQVPARLGATNTVRLAWDAYREHEARSSWYFPRTTRMFGPAAAVLGSDPRLYRLLHRALRLRGDLVQTAVARLTEHGLQPGGFLAVHVRRGDFQYPAMRHLPNEAVVEAMRRHGADASGTVLVVSDAFEEDLLERCRRAGWNPVCWSASEGGEDPRAGVVDMLCCCLAWRFVGTPLSTFSSGIMQWRGHVSRVAGAKVDAVPRFTNEVDQVPWWGRVDERAWLTV